MTNHEDTEVRYVQHLRAPNDSNGNPRRLWVLYGADGTVVRVVDEEYNGRAAVPAGAVELLDVDIAPSEYRRVLKRYSAR